MRGRFDSTRPVFNDAANLVAANYTKGMSVNRILYCRSQATDEITTIQPFISESRASNGGDIFLTTLGLSESGERCAVWKPIEEGDKIEQIWMPETNLAMRVFTQRGELTTIGKMSSRATSFVFDDASLFVGFYGQLDSSGLLVSLGVLEDRCTVQDWDSIKASETNQVRDD